MVPGDDDVAFLMPPDVGRKRVPDQLHLGPGRTRAAPIWQDYPCIDRHLSRGDAAAFRTLVPDTAGEHRLHRPWMAMAGGFHLRAASVELFQDGGERRAADRIIAVCPDDISRIRRGDKSRRQHRCNQPGFHRAAFAGPSALDMPGYASTRDAPVTAAGIAALADRSRLRGVSAR